MGGAAAGAAESASASSIPSASATATTCAGASWCPASASSSGGSLSANDPDALTSSARMQGMPWGLLIGGQQSSDALATSSVARAIKQASVDDWPTTFGQKHENAAGRTLRRW